jgi:hypothetical protein
VDDEFKTFEIATPCAHRIGKLIHSHFNICRQKLKGCLCSAGKLGGVHTEWFEVSAEYAREIITMCVDWIKVVQAARDIEDGKTWTHNFIEQLDFPPHLSK